MRQFHFTLLLAGFVFVSGRAGAADSSDKASAEALFDQGRQLMTAGNFAEACPKFEASQRLDPGVGTLLNLADCYEKSGKTASAWAQFREAVSAARTAGSEERERTAKDRATALEPRLAYVTVVPWKGQTVVVTRDGTRVDEAMVGSPIPVDPGIHVIAATAAGKRQWSTSVEVAEGQKVSVAVPILPDEGGGGAVMPPMGGGGSAAPADQGSDGSTQRTLALVAGGVGVVGVAVGTIFGLKAQSNWSDAKAECEGDLKNCGSKGVQLHDDAESAATVSTVGWVVGAAGLAGGAVLWFTAPSGSGGGDKGVALGVGPGKVTLQGRF